MHYSTTKEEVYKIRESFFQEIFECLSRPPEEIDSILEQEKYYISPILNNPKQLIQDYPHGIFLMTFQPKFFGKEFEFSYSIFLAGDWLKIAILFMNSDLNDAPNQDSQREIDVVWDRTPDTMWRGQDKLMIEWRFEEKDIYSNYATREKYVLNMRHMHFRILKMFYNYCKNLSEQDE